MNIVVEKQPKCTATLRVEIPSDKVSGKREQIVRGYASQARLPGFRPGKAPRAIVEKRFEREITEELNGALINEAYDEALKELIAAKQKGDGVIEAPEPDDTNVIDLMEALRASLKGSGAGKKAPAKKPAAKKPAAKKAPAKKKAA